MRATITATLLLTLATTPGAAADPDAAPLERGFRDTVRPFVQTYCSPCHAGAKPKGDLDLSAYGTAEAVGQDLRRWETVAEQLREGAMPPKKAKQQPTDELRREVVAW